MALGTGRTVTELKQAMTERELSSWIRYKAQEGFPWRRLELQLALLALIMTRMNGNVDMELSDFLFDAKEPPPELTVEQGARLFAGLSGTTTSGIHILGQGRKKKEGA